MYQCPRCHYTTKNKCDLKNHFNKKKVCDTLFENISIKKLKEKVLEKNAFKIEQHICNHCLKTFVRKDSLIRHLNTNCCKNNNNIIYEIKDLKKKIEELKNYQRPITNNYYTQNNFQNIKINAFRKENIGYLSSDYIQELAKRGMYYAIPKLIKKIYFNENHPENQNVKITNEKSKYAEIFDGQRFVKLAKNLVVRDMIHFSINVIDDLCCNIEMPNSYHIFSNKYNENDRLLMNSLYKKAEGIALTFSKLLH